MVQIGGVLQYTEYRLELYWGISLSSRLRSQENTVIQMGVDCCANWRRTAVLLRQVVRVGGAERCPTVPAKGSLQNGMIRAYN